MRNDSSLASALAPLRDKLPRLIIEREILRVVCTIPPTTDGNALKVARDEVLKWARKRAGGELPEAAWQGEAFEVLAAGRTTIGASVETDGNLLWSLRGDDPDKVVPGRIWSTEVSLGRSATQENILVGVRLLVNSNETELIIEPSVPGLVLQIADKCGLQDGPVPAWASPHFAETDAHVDTLLDWLRSQSRRLPIIIASGDERSLEPDRALIDVDVLAKALCGLAHIVSLPSKFTYRLSDQLGKSFTVFHGGVRIYGPGFDVLSDPRGHRLYLGAALAANPSSVVAEIRSGIARDSLRRSRLGHDVLPFAAVRSAALRTKQSRQIEEGASDAEKLAAANIRTEALEQEVKGLRSEADQALELSVQEANRAEDAEKQLSSAWARIEQLEAALTYDGRIAGTQIPGPTDWENFAVWCDSSFPSKLSLTSTARRGVRKPDFADIELAAKSISWLANEARARFLEGGGTLTNIPVLEGVTNAPCGADEYQFDFQGRRLLASWHIKSGGNTRQPERCLRIYYTFDEVSRQIIVSDMPAHRKTGAT